MLLSNETLKGGNGDHIAFKVVSAYPKYKVRYCKIWWISRGYEDEEGNQALELHIQKKFIDKWEYNEIQKEMKTEEISMPLFLMLTHKVKE